MPPEPPPARGEPVGERGGERHGRDVARRGTGDKSPGLFVLQGISGFGRLRPILPGTGRGTTEGGGGRSEEHTSELQSLMRISYAVFCLKKKKHTSSHHPCAHTQSRQQRTQPHLRP